MGDAKEVLGGMFGGGEARGDVETRADGTFELRGVRSGTPLQVTAKARLHVAAAQRVAAIATGSTRDGVELVLGAAGRVSVTAVGVRGATSVKLQWAGAPSADAPKDRDGLLRRSRITIDGLEPGPWRVQLEGAGLTPDLQPRVIEIAPGETARVDFGR
jgi:hypothetical protein